MIGAKVGYVGTVAFLGVKMFNYAHYKNVYG